MAKRIGFVLSGCGVFDGTEIHEAVLSMLALSRRGYELVFLAPDMKQMHVVNHQTGEAAAGESRNVMVESARIARGPVRNIADAKAAEFDGLFFPGGFGAAKNLSTFAVDGAGAKVQPDVARLIKEMHDSRKPLGFICIAPVCAAKALGAGVELTIGTDEGAAAAIDSMGARHVSHSVAEAQVDSLHRVVSAPAYMLAANIVEVEASVNAAVEAFAKLVDG